MNKLTDQQKMILNRIYNNYRASHSSMFKQPWTQLTHEEAELVRDCFAIEISSSLKAVPNKDISLSEYIKHN